MGVDEPILAVVVITRNEALHIGACLESISQAIAAFPEAPVVVVDSNSNDDTIAVATRYPVTVYQYRAPLLTAAAGRRIGFEKVRAQYVLFVDGDCCIEAGWVKVAVELMNESPDVAVIYGTRREVFEGVSPDFRSAGPAPEEYGLGGNALYRSKSLRQAGGFNPFLISREEEELLGRLQALGYRDLQIHELMVTHHTIPKDTVQGFIRRRRRGMTWGIGQVLRLNLGRKQFAHYLLQYNRYILTFLYLVSGIALGVVGVLLNQPSFPIVWLLVGATAFILLWMKRRSMRSAIYLVVYWLIMAIGMVVGFLKTPKPLDSFTPLVERIR
jgi:glycosyltransferase involved in cell wall biosynthesis